MDDRVSADAVRREDEGVVSDLVTVIAEVLEEHDTHIEWVGDDRTDEGLLRATCVGCSWRGESRVAGPATGTEVAVQLGRDQNRHVAEVVASRLNLHEEWMTVHESGGGIIHDSYDEARRRFDEFVERPPGVEDPGSGGPVHVACRWVSSWEAIDGAPEDASGTPIRHGDTNLDPNVARNVIPGAKRQRCDSRADECGGWDE